MSFVNFPASLQAALQENMLNREFEEGLDSILAYRRMALTETINARIGETLTRTRKGRTAPSITPLSGANMQANLDNSLTPQTYALEQYTFTLNSYAASQDVYLIQELAGIADQTIAASRNNGVASAQTLERLAKMRLFAAYNTGNTWVTTAGGASTTTSCHVDDIRGFQYVLVNGTPTAISATNPITVQELSTSSSGVTQTLTVTAATPDATNVSTYPGSGGAGTTDGISGTLTFNTATAPANGDALVAVNAPTVLRPNQKMTTAELTGADTLTMGNILDAVQALRDNGVPALSNGNYACVLDNSSARALFSDQQFNVLFAGANRSLEWRSGDMLDMMGVTFIPTTEAYVQSPIYAGGPRIRRPIVMGAESIIQGNFEGLDMWLAREGVSAIGNVMLVNGVAQIIRPPLDRLMQQLSLSWMWVGDFAIPTDATATTDIIPTASNSTYKRAIVIEHAG